MLATGNNLRSLSHFFRISKSSLSLMIPVICDAIYNALEIFIQVPRNSEEWEAIGNGFRKFWNFPGCCGAIDGKHVVIKAPFEAGSYFYNYKQQNSLVLMALVDDNYCFSYIDIGCNGRISDGGVFRNCNLSEALENGLLPEHHLVVLYTTGSESSKVRSDFEDTENGRFVEGSWRQLPSEGLVPIPRHMYNHPSQNAREIRENFADYFMGEESVSWQSRMIH
ncbi:unnamed protein product [Euphydryas editha]|uniref:FHA domain-containing protein n=1 Tax=Euphydryas editha TaxID=104508 RepID=A0AAU9U3K0_EUPED|nr:unnamed protein product [Euphydryas editha]